jgi:putative redox protein
MSSQVSARLGRIPYRVSLSDGTRQWLADIANACPLHRLLSGEIRIDTQLTPEDHI